MQFRSIYLSYPTILSLIMALASVAHAKPCSGTRWSGPAWTTRSGCLAVPLNPADPESGSIRIYYEFSKPDGKSLGNLIVFHGGPAYPRRHLQSEGPLWSALRSHYRILYFHQRGSGYSGRIAEAAELEGKDRFYSLDMIVHDCALLHQELFPEQRVILLGKSAGGFIALKYALRYPEQVTRLILAATSPHHGYLSQRHRVEADFMASLEERYEGYLDRYQHAVAILDPGLLKSAPVLYKLLLKLDVLENVVFDLSYTLAGQREAVAVVQQMSQQRFSLFLQRLESGRETLVLSGLESLPLLNRISCREFGFGDSSPTACTGVEADVLFDVRPELERLTMPTLVMSGRYDPILPLEFQEAIASRLSGNIIWHILDLSAHMLFREQPRATTQLVLDFLAVPHQQPAQVPGL